MNRIWRVVARLLILTIIVALYGLVIYSAIVTTRTEAARNTPSLGKNILVKGTLLSLTCIIGGKDRGCPLWGYKYENLILLSDKRTLYNLDLNAIPKWKADKGFGNKVIIVGVRQGQNIVVQDLVPLEGGGKVSKACL